MRGGLWEGEGRVGCERAEGEYGMCGVMSSEVWSS